MKTGTILISLIVVVIIIAVAYLVVSGAYSKSPYATTSLGSSSLQSTSTISGSGATTSILVYPQGGTNHTITEQQVITALGTGWTSAAQFNYDSQTNITLQNGTKVMVKGYGVGNFSNGGEFLATKWIQFSSVSSSIKYINSTFNSSFANPTNVTRGTMGGASYIFYSGDAINKGQAASVMYAYDGPYAITIFNQGTSFPIAMGKQLLSDQLLNLNVS